MVMLPGSNLLKTALTVIARQEFLYLRFRSRTAGPNGLDVTEYWPGVKATGSAQPVPRDLYDRQGLDMQRTYWNFFLERKVIDIDRDVAGDQFEYKGDRYQCLSRTPWYDVDGWDQVLCVKVQA